MLLLITYVLIALTFSFICSIAEAVLLSVSSAHIALLEQAGKRSGAILHKLKEDINKPLAAVLRHGALMEMTENTAKIAFDSFMWRTRIEEVENKKVLSAAFEQCFQRPINLEVLQEDLQQGYSLADHKEELVQKKKLKLQKEAMAEPLVSQAMNIFNASVCEVKKLAT